MSILKKNITRPGTSLMLVAIMIGVFALHGSAASAKGNTACGPMVIIGTSTSSPANCDVAVSANTPGQLTFTSDVNAALDTGTVTVGDNFFTFTANVMDERNTMAGWQLQATSAGLTGTGLTALPLTITSSTATCAPLTGGPATSTCPAPTSVTAPVALNDTGSPQTLVAETYDGTNPIYGVATITIHGKYTVPLGAQPGAYTGAITLSLVGTSS